MLRERLAAAIRQTVVLLDVTVRAAHPMPSLIVREHLLMCLAACHPCRVLVVATLAEAIIVPFPMPLRRRLPLFVEGSGAQRDARAGNGFGKGKRALPCQLNAYSATLATMFTAMTPPKGNEGARTART